MALLNLCNIICLSGPYFAHYVPFLNKKRIEGQLQTFDRLSKYKITTFETLKAKFMKNPVLAFPD